MIMNEIVICKCHSEHRSRERLTDSVALFVVSNEGREFQARMAYDISFSPPGEGKEVEILMWAIVLLVNYIL